MKRFLIQVLVFLILSSIVLITLFYSTTEIVKSKADFKISDKIDKIIVGHSHPECAYNDSLIDNFRNYSRSGESFFYTYYKTVQLINANHNIKTVFVEFTNNQIDSFMNQGIWGEKYMPHFYPIYQPFVSVEDNEFLFKKNASCLISCIGTGIQNSVLRIVKKDYHYTEKIGAYQYLVRDKTDSLLANPIVKEEAVEGIYPVSNYNISYLEKIIEACKKETKQVVLIRTPQHKKYEGFFNEKIFQKCRMDRFSDIVFLDFNDFPLLDSDFGDLEHLNFRGARKFSIFFSYLLENGLLSNENPQEFINDEMTKWNSDTLLTLESK